MSNEYIDINQEMEAQKVIALEDWIYAKDVLNNVKEYKVNFSIEPEGMTEERAQARLDESLQKCRSLGITDQEIEDYEKNRLTEKGKINPSK